MTTQNIKNSAFNLKKFTSYLTFFSFFILSVTGLILYFTPHGSYSRWSNWKFLLMSKDHLEGIHTIFSFIFILCILLHLYNNLKTFLTYLRTDFIIKKFTFSKEFILSSFLTLVFLAGSYFMFPPFSTVVNLGENLKKSWEKSSVNSPLPDFENHTIRHISKKVFNVPAQKIIQILKNNSFSIINDLQTIKEIAAINSSSPQEIYLIIKKNINNT